MYQISIVSCGPNSRHRKVPKIVKRFFSQRTAALTKIIKDTMLLKGTVSAEAF